jgi:acyl dehydratase
LPSGLDSALVGHRIGTITTVCDARWLMSYAAGVPDERPELYDTTARLVTHPVFAVAPEWELLVRHRSTSTSMTAAEVSRGVHVAHDLIIERPIRPGETIDVTATVVGVGRRSAGATQTVLFEAVDTDHQVVWRTMHTSLFLGVELVGEPGAIDATWPALPEPLVDRPRPIAERSSWVRPIDAHVYTECARIWNPIHTDVAVARSAGLDAPILHGTATLARAVSIVTELAGAPLADVTRISCAFSAMVALGSTITVRLLAADAGALRFDVVNGAGDRAVRDGLIVVAAAD